MPFIPTEVLRKRRQYLAEEIIRLNARLAEIDHWLEVAGDTKTLDRDPPAGYLGRQVVGEPGTPTIVSARDPRKIKRKG